MSNQKPRIGVDLDNVLFDFTPAFCEYSNAEFGTDLTSYSYHEHWAKIWGQNDELLPHNELMDRWHYMIGEKFFEKILPIKNAAEILRRLKELGYELVVLTTRSANNPADDKEIRRQTRDSLSRDFSGIFDEIHFLGIWKGADQEKGHQITKSELFDKLNLDYLIDDQTKHVNAINASGEPRGILFGSFAHQEDAAPNTPHFDSWNDDLLKYFENKINGR